MVSLTRFMNIAFLVSAGCLLALSADVASGQAIVNRNTRIPDVFDTAPPKAPVNPRSITLDPVPVTVPAPSSATLATPTYPTRVVKRPAATSGGAITPPAVSAYPVASSAPLATAPVVTSTPLRITTPTPTASAELAAPRISAVAPAPFPVPAYSTPAPAYTAPAPVPAYSAPVPPVPRLSSGLGAPTSPPPPITVPVPENLRFSTPPPPPTQPRPVATAFVPTPRSAPSTSFDPRLSGPSKSYVFSANDVVDLKVFQEPELDSRVRVNKDGNVTLPLIGTIRLAGRTVDQATAMIREALDRRFLVNPQVNLTVVDYAKRRFTVMGEVQKPGSFEIPNEESVNLLQALALAGGYTRIGEPTRVTVVRVENGQRTILKLNAKSMARDQKSAPFEIRPDDTITVGESVF